VDEIFESIIPSHISHMIQHRAIIWATNHQLEWVVVDSVVRVHEVHPARLDHLEEDSTGIVMTDHIRGRGHRCHMR